ncbi:MAG: SUMF1/EgtB/PvdO family nonheme iron enzyme [Phycisphaerae bacterium]|nr:SUMF1/EgtB/PvdO family nonheme iron enzyme [Phycisphaerae bacterium]
MNVLSACRFVWWLGWSNGAGDSGMNGRALQIVLGLAAVMLLTGSVRAEHPIPEAQRWATITHAGNEPYVYDPAGPITSRSIAGVDYEYQISRTEVTGAEWFEFVQAFAPYVQEDAVNAIDFKSQLIGVSGYREYFLPPENENRPIKVGWTFAARYVNWLHNGKALTPDAFENGAYDLSLIDGSNFEPDLLHNPDATYWIPTEDEWLKACHFDPNRYGEGMPGYWLYSNGSDSPSAYGSPANGGETSTGGRLRFALPDVAAYGSVQSPWGLWDTSGGYDEWVTSPMFGDLSAYGPFARGSSYDDLYDVALDRGWDRINGGTPLASVAGLRVARAVPGPGSVWAVVCAVPFITRRRRHTDDKLLSNCPWLLRPHLPVHRHWRARRAGDHADSRERDRLLHHRRGVGGEQMDHRALGEPGRMSRRGGAVRLTDFNGV